MAKQKLEVHLFGRVVTSLAVLSLLFAVGSTSASAHVAGKSKYGGTLELAVATPPDCLDPQKTAAASSDEVDSFVFDSLLSIDNHGHYVGDLATGYKVSKGGTVVTFTLRHGVRFSNGDPFTAAAVRFTFDRALNPATKSPVTAGQLADVAATKAVSKYKVQLDLKAASRPLLTNLSGAYASIMDPKATKKQGSNSCTDPIGTGVYKIKSTGASFGDVKLVENKYHTFAPSWVHNQGHPYIPNVEIQTIPSVDTAISDLLTGALSMSDVPGTQLSRVKGNKSILLHKLPSDNLDWISFNNAHKPFNKPAVRKAVAEVIDRKGMIKAALNGLGVPVYGPLPPALAYYDKAAGQDLPKFNIKAAAKVFKQYHMTGSGHTYQLLACTCAPFNTMSEILQADLGLAGLNVKIEGVGGVGDFVGKATAGDYDIDMLNYIYPDPSVLAFLLAKGAPLNWLNYDNPTLDKLLAEQGTTLKGSRVTRIFDQIQTLVNKQAIFVGMDSETMLLGVRSNLKGFHLDTPGSYAVQDLYFG